MMTKHKIGIALGSGGARGWCHIGVLPALAQEGVEPNVVAGCSMGAFVGATYVAGALEALEEFALSLTWRKIPGYLDFNPVSGGLIEGKRIVSLLRSLFWNSSAQRKRLKRDANALSRRCLCYGNICIRRNCLAAARRKWIRQGEEFPQRFQHPLEPDKL